MRILGGVAAACLVVFIYRLYAEAQVANVCDMTYMFPNYIPLPVNGTSPHATRYTLFWYREGRLTGRVEPKGSLRGVPVLFIPGNAGSGRQVRSLGAVAARTFSHAPLGVYSDSDIEHVKLGQAAAGETRNQFDFFSLHFDEELSAFHGAILEEHAAFANLCIKQILSFYTTVTTKPVSVVLVGHSMGGMVARSLPRFAGYVQGSVRSIITLATPHRGAPYGFFANPALYRFYLDTWAGSNESDDLVVLSLGGGARDILVRGDLTHLYELPGGGTAISGTTDGLPRAWLTTDHLAILWCNQVVNALVTALFDLVDGHTQQATRSRDEVASALGEHFSRGYNAAKPATFPHIARPEGCAQSKVGSIDTVDRCVWFTMEPNQRPLVTTPQESLEFIICGDDCRNVTSFLRAYPYGFSGMLPPAQTLYVVNFKGGSMRVNVDGAFQDATNNTVAVPLAGSLSLSLPYRKLPIMQFHLQGVRSKFLPLRFETRGASVAKERFCVHIDVLGTYEEYFVRVDGGDISQTVAWGVSAGADVLVTIIGLSSKSTTEVTVEYDWLGAGAQFVRCFLSTVVMCALGLSILRLDEERLTVNIATFIVVLTASLPWGGVLMVPTMISVFATADAQSDHLPFWSVTVSFFLAAGLLWIVHGLFAVLTIVLRPFKFIASLKLPLPVMWGLAMVAAFALIHVTLGVHIALLGACVVASVSSGDERVRRLKFIVVYFIGTLPGLSSLVVAIKAPQLPLNDWHMQIPGIAIMAHLWLMAKYPVLVRKPVNSVRAAAAVIAVVVGTALPFTGCLAVGLLAITEICSLFIGSCLGKTKHE